jgi:endonuclease VIII
LPEGDSLRRAAGRLQPLVGQKVEVETPNPRAQGRGIADRLNGLRLESVEAVGKNLLLTFEGGAVLRSHLRMTGRWRVEPRGAPRVGLPWLVLRGQTHEAVLWNGPVLELDGRRVTDRLGPDILDGAPRFEVMVANLRAAGPDRAVGDVLLDQRRVAGIGNMWKAECLWAARVSPWAPLAALTDEQLLTVLEEAHRLMRTGLEGARPLRRVYRRAGRACRRCGARIRSRGQGDDNRTAYWCPGCQSGPEGGEAAPSA